DEVAIDYVDLSLEAASDGTLRIANAFKPPKPSAEPEKQSNLRIVIDSLRLNHVWAHGRMDAQWIDADIDDIKASLDYSSEATSITLRQADVQTRAAPRGADLNARVAGKLTLAGDKPSVEAK